MLSQTLMAACANEGIALWPVTWIMCGKHFSPRKTKQFELRNSGKLRWKFLHLH